MKPRTIFVAAFVLVALAGQAQDPLAQLKSLPRVLDVQKIQARGGGDAFDVTFQQPVDHASPNGPKFGQHVFVVVAGGDQPTLLNTEGYQARGPQGGELRRMLGNPNLVTVEHRYFGRSIPEPCVWEHLTVKNAADDMHDIVTTFKRLFKGKWVSTGASKSGQTSLYFKCYYPDDVDAVVAYVAPINLNAEDPRINTWIQSIGDPATQARIKAYQIALLKREDEVLAALKPDPKQFSMGVEKAYEFGVLEWPYGFWQYGSNVDPKAIPDPDAPVQALVDAFKKVGSMDYYGDRLMKTFEAFQYQAFTEVGYYNYDITDFKPYLKHNPDPTNRVLMPAGTAGKAVYNPATLAFVFHTLQYSAKNIVFIYGETDAWSATQMELLGRTNSIKIVVKGAWHNANVGLMSPEQKTLFFDTMDSWLGMKLVRN